MLLEEKLAHLPDHPGVYLMRDAQGQVIYVGKAASLRNRVRSYFHGQHPPRIQALVRQVADVEYILTDNEVEALALECNLIKEYRPRYNINLKDDKSYPYLRLTLQEEFPHLEVTRRIVQDGSRYFGPYTRVGALKETLKLLGSLFPLRTCRDTPLKLKSRPCLNAHLGRCLAPCTGKVSSEEYRRAVQEMILFLEGKQGDLIRRLRSEMEEAAKKLEFERAARLRDRIKAIEEVLAQQKVISPGREDRDAIALAREHDEAVGMIFFIREGKLIGREHFFLEGQAGLEAREVMAALVKQFYSRGVEIPPEILLEEEAEDQETIATWLSQLKGSKVSIKVPRRGEKARLMSMVRENAFSVLKEYLLAREREEVSSQQALEELKDVLSLPAIPWRMEAFDISNLQGTEAVGSMVVFVGGRPDPSSYRRFRIKNVQGPNDYACLQEVLSRRFRRLAEGDPKFSARPDFVLIDGGQGQLSAAREVMRRLGVQDIPTFSLAKGEELIFREGDAQPLVLPKDSIGLRLLQRLRDEAHRFAITYHRQRRDKGALASVLDDIPGIGPKRKRALLRHFGSVENIRRASLEELLQVEGMNRVVAARLKEILG
ncbi:Excinuclease ABC subunit C [Thermanaeromonas toyohensis ToBE]|uniref:UvrABC system protein C n=1 Tax=Thermanaeromonas toyohensis ToBE TaxID=698762 RepID=A0A1W1VDQ0_9FIRM|nr:excinuclease ABC subunit UvrC [Thermanaeromonas toyohensis]SMB91498.1 Excinuclease ABC subunit C [Thermanaeromonas toyohensis ToBE]